MQKTIATDIAIFGGGVAGLWLLNRLQALGLSATLFEVDTLGGGQTCQSQGIIHGGMKYALQGVLNKEVHAMADLPALWDLCFAGEGEIDLSSVPILSPRQYLWSPGRFTSKLAGLMANAALTSKVESLPKESYPAVFQNKQFKGELFALNETVLDVFMLIKALAKKVEHALVKIAPFSLEDLHLQAEGRLMAVSTCLAEEPVQIKAQHFIFTAGEGNALITEKLNQPTLAMQRRPLHMVMVKVPFDYPLFAHCQGFGPKPRLTVTTHRLSDGSFVWYLGGGLAEEGVRLSEAEQIKATQNELSKLFPWLDFSRAQFATNRVDRAEPYQANGLKPDTSFLKSYQNITVAWPTKLALAPKLAEEVMLYLTSLNLAPQYKPETAGLPKPALSTPLWENAFCKKNS